MYTNSKLAGHILTFLRTICSDNDIEPMWVLVVPLYRLLAGCPMPDNTRYTAMEWWTTDKLLPFMVLGTG